MLKKRNYGAVGVLGIVLLVVAMSGCVSDDNSSNGSSSSNSSASQISFTNVSVTGDGYGSYTIKGDLIPTSNMDYVEMVAVWYDASGAVIDQDPLSWNSNNLVSGQEYKVNGISDLYDKGTPTKVDLYFFNSPFSGGDYSSAFYKHTVNING
jgi:hypothetical protein